MENEDKLDQWLHQTLQSGSQPPEQKIVHQGQKAPSPDKQTPINQHTPQTPQAQKPQTVNPPNQSTSQPQTPHQKQNQPQEQKKSFQRPRKPQRPPFKVAQGKPQPQTDPRTQKKPGFIKKLSNSMLPRFGKYRGKLRIIPLGGLNEVGKNCMILEYGQDIIIIDMGYQFPEADLLGVDYIIPDISYLLNKKDRIRGIIFTHGHLDHIGAVSYVAPQLNFPMMYGTQLTMGLIQKQMEEFGLVNQAKIKVITANDTLQLGPFNISFFNVNHSIPDSVGIVVKTPAGNIVHTGDFKFDMTPSGAQKPADFAKISALSHQDIGALFIDSTNALKPGHTITEKTIGQSLESIVKNNTEGRIIIASFSSQIGRLQQIIDIAQKYGRNIILSGRSLVNNFTLAGKLGYLRVPKGLVHEIHRAKKMPDNKALILTTGSQGEDVAALSRMALEEHPIIKIKKGDTVILSSSPIPGNERAVTNVTNNLARLGAHIINNQIMDVHASGHAQQEDLKLMMTLVKARAVVPIHGEYFMRAGNKEVAMSIGYGENQAIIIENGDVLEIENNEAKFKGERIETKYVLVDGLGVGDIGAQVIMDRQTLAENGVLVILIPVDERTRKIKGEIEVISRGFIYMKESEALIKEIAEITTNSYQNIINKRPDAKRGDVKKYVREMLDKFVHQKIDRSPLILPILLEK